MDPQRVLCTCSICSKSSFTDETGVERQGLYKHPSTCRKHWAKDTQMENTMMEESMTHLTLEDSKRKSRKEINAKNSTGSDESESNSDYSNDVGYEKPPINQGTKSIFSSSFVKNS
ncbi:hypothetical protein O181_060432 [Austropuccinia psidii MF-1]|uniref:Uncharacterized protein n=1 Tax=Austropuccinia psidii MF-1 TaxID=1389203 RepID=A0A9Q3EIN6_9BASI|nr:hypothetical protein [Austropuccinia psidii MF-1]